MKCGRNYPQSPLNKKGPAVSDVFENWFEEQDWWHKASRREDFDDIHAVAILHKIPDHVLVDIIDRVCDAMRDEYGD